MLADFYHMYENGKNISDIKKYKDSLVHCHIAGYITRSVFDRRKKFLNLKLKYITLFVFMEV